MGSRGNIDWCLESSAPFVRMAGQVTDAERPFRGVGHMKQRLPILSLKSPVQRNIVPLLKEEGEGITERFQQEKFFFFFFLIILLSRFQAAFLVSEAARFKLNWDIVHSG